MHYRIFFSVFAKKKGLEGGRSVAVVVAVGVICHVSCAMTSQAPLLREVSWRKRLTYQMNNWIPTVYVEQLKAEPFPLEVSIPLHFRVLRGVADTH